VAVRQAQDEIIGDIMQRVEGKAIIYTDENLRREYELEVRKRSLG
jgi:hypothetical protein